MQCSNNLKQVGLGLLNYESSYNSLPPGGMGPSNACPSSWWVRILAFAEQNNVYDSYSYSGGGWTGDGANPNHTLLSNKPFGFMYCPSSPLRWDSLEVPSSGSAETHVSSATYAGVSGATNHSTTQTITTGNVSSKVSLGGVLLPDRCVTVGEITDGMSNTIVVGEQSDWLTPGDVNGRSDCWHGFPMGATLKSLGNRIFNLTSVRYAINMKSATAAGVADNCGGNSPIQSAHSNGVNSLFADGSVQFLAETIELSVLFNLCNRNDGNPIPGNTW
jgi:prepilin-type processing-associated H-X9-DG protein